MIKHNLPSDADAAAQLVEVEQAERCYEQDDYAAAHAHYQHLGRDQSR